MWSKYRFVNLVINWFKQPVVTREDFLTLFVLCYIYYGLLQVVAEWLYYWMNDE
jgi:hypothetical protein